MLRPVVIDRFGGLDLRGDPAEGAQAIDLMNVTLEPGTIRCRDGSGDITTVTGLVGAYPFLRLNATAQIIALGTAGANNLVALNANTGATIASATLGSVSSRGFAGTALGTPTASYFFASAAPGTGAVDAQRWNGATWTAAGGLPGAIRALATSPTDNRLVVAGEGSKLSFSDAGAPETFGANNFVRLTPGDGEEINGLAVYGNQLLAFKQTKFFVFYGNSVDSTGLPVFNYRTVDSGIGMRGHAPQAVCAGPDGVYFIAQDGIYRTTGGDPRRVSPELDPLFRAEPPPYWLGMSTYTPGTEIGRLTWFDGKLYASLIGSGGTGCMFVRDPDLGWSAWDVKPSGLLSVPDTAFGGDLPRLVFDIAGKLLYSKAELTTDDGTAIVSRYRASFDSFGSTGRKRIRETIAEGTGTPFIKWSSDWEALDAGGFIAFGATPNTGRVRRAIRGRFFSFQASRSAGSWSLNRIQANVDGDLGEPHVAMTP